MWMLQIVGAMPVPTSVTNWIISITPPWLRRLADPIRGTTTNYISTHKGAFQGRKSLLWHYAKSIMLTIKVVLLRTPLA
jgi:hypothetical protein